jgi:hypothetical protein
VQHARGSTSQLAKNHTSAHATAAESVE